jgi:hypothetical protein
MKIELSFSKQETTDSHHIASFFDRDPVIGAHSHG